MYIDNKLLSGYSKKIKEYSSFLKECESVFKANKIKITEHKNDFDISSVSDKDLQNLVEEYFEMKSKLSFTQTTYDNLVKKIRTFD